MKRLIALLTIILCGLPAFLNAQQTDEDSQKPFDVFNEKISNRLLPLGAMIDSAVSHNPTIRFRDLQIIVNECKLKAEKIEWLRNLGVQSDIRYGTFENFSTNTLDDQTATTIGIQTVQTTYGFGAYLKFPIFDLAGRKNQIKMAKAEVEQAKSMAQSQRKEVRELVIRQYNNLILQQRLLKVRSDYLELAKANFLMIQKEFENGVIDITEYSRIAQINSRAESDFEVTRNDFITSYLVLEEIVGFKFHLINTQ